MPPHNGHNVFSARVPLDLDLLGQLRLDYQHCSGQMSHNHPPERVSIRTELRRWQKLSPGATLLCALHTLILKDGAVARLGLRLDQRIFLLCIRVHVVTMKIRDILVFSFHYALHSAMTLNADYEKKNV